MQILQQIGELFLQAVPTIIIVLLFYFFLRWAFFSPLTRAMDQRRQRTEGARAEAQAAEVAARNEWEAYQQAIRDARTQIYAEQEAARKATFEESAKLIKSARRDAELLIRAAKERIAGELAAARSELETQSADLARDIARHILAGRAAQRLEETR